MDVQDKRQDVSIYIYLFIFFHIFLQGYAGYFFVRAAFFWLSILSFDIWRNIKENLQTGIKSHNKLYWLYSLLVWGVALLCTMLTALAEWSKIDSCWKPGIGTKHCWLDGKQKIASL